jgi:hypothetical protein
MTYSLNKYLVFLLTTVFILVIVYRCFDGISSFERRANIILDDQPTQEKRKFVAILSKK